MENNIFEIVTEKMIQQLEQGVCPWHRPWATNGCADGAAISHESGKAYSFINQMLLGKGGEWLTFKQVKAEGGSVKKGEKASLVVFWKMNVKETEQEDGTKKVDSFPVLKHYYVFHIDQTEGIKAKHELPAPAEGNNDNARNETADMMAQTYVIREGITLTLDQYADGAFYRPSTDEVVVPMISQFESSAEFYSALFHELTHSTGHESRLKRLTKTAAFGSAEYSREELVAEMGSAYLCNIAGVSTDEAFKNSAAYLKGWAKALKNDARMIVTAAGKAETAVRYILNGKQDGHKVNEQEEGNGKGVKHPCYI